jgi:predicted N-acetyltransferase YhbS/uncharacterized protein YdhG (YjbR/CyaY superfamily)
MNIDNLTLRRERKADHETVDKVAFRAFDAAPPTDSGDDGNEALLAHKLRSRAAFIPELDYVAELDGRIVGNIMYSKSKVVGEREGAPPDGEWEVLTFGPVSVLPKYQKQGIGGALIRKTLELAREIGYRAVVIFGRETYYPRFGFKPAIEYGITTADGKNFPAFMALPLYDGALDGVHGRFYCDDVFFTLDRAESDAYNAKLAEPMDIDEYIAAQSSEAQPILQAIRETIRVNAPEAIEKISYQMPTFWQGGNLIHFAVQKKHIGVYPGGEAVVVFADRLAEYKTSKGAIQFPLNKPIDRQLIADIVKWGIEYEH